MVLSRFLEVHNGITALMGPHETSWDLMELPWACQGTILRLSVALVRVSKFPWHFKTPRGI